jgi:hypothetical protein
MVFRRSEPQQQVTGGIMLGGDGAGVQVMGEQLREVDAPIEALVGAANGMIHGAGLGAAASAAITFAESGELSGRQIINNLKSAHLGPIIGAALAFSAISGFVRYSRASKHNEWSQKHYDFLHSKIDAAKENKATTDSPKSFAEREDKKQEKVAGSERGLG